LNFFLKKWQKHLEDYPEPAKPVRKGPPCEICQGTGSRIHWMDDNDFSFDGCYACQGTGVAQPPEKKDGIST